MVGSGSLSASTRPFLAQRRALEHDQARLTLRAPLAGTVCDVDPEVQGGQWINPGVSLLGIRAGARIEAYVAEEDVPRFQAGASASFLSDSGGARRRARVLTIDRVARKTLSDPELAVPHGGPLPARFDGKALVPDAALYRVVLGPEDGRESAVVERGRVTIDAERRSWAGFLVRRAATVLLREGGF